MYAFPLHIIIYRHAELFLRRSCILASKNLMITVVCSRRSRVTFACLHAGIEWMLIRGKYSRGHVIHINIPWRKQIIIHLVVSGGACHCQAQSRDL